MYMLTMFVFFIRLSTI